MKQECPTRWNSAFYMLERFILLSEIIARVLFQLDTAPQNLTSLEIKLIKESIYLLQPFEQITREISGEKFMTASKIIPIRTILKKHLESHIVMVTEEGKILQQRLKIEFYQRFLTVEKETLLGICTILDPRFKKVHFQSPVSAANAIGLIDEEMRNIIETQHRPTVVSDVSVQISTEENKIGLWEEHDAMVNTESNQYHDDEVNCEKRLYLQQPIIDCMQSPIEFWLKSPFPVLTKIALKYFTVVATSVASERLFSKAGNIITDHRSRLNHRRLEKLVFLSSIESKFWDV
ncbi:zinc finger BED domain-containing protein 4-like [Aphis craccivora]|uniref:Zinc finger BED domain-containing protein 4-like n=1 Tax=Aphis craccivora TaxID=307492 RepID=A0A6G0W2N5_APHCR|nr:zinc finger BED domain-containing protein 4-like [Aphis craccivora]